MTDLSRILIYPSWADFKYQWKDLPSLFLAPEKWIREEERPYYAKLGYSVSEKDHKFFDGPRGGGLIEVFNPFQKWFPNVLFTDQASITSPKGFIRSGDYGAYVLVPRITIDHRIGGEPAPLAPSPHCSVEQAALGASECRVALSITKRARIDDATMLNGFPSLGLEVERAETNPESVQAAFAAVDDPRLRWQWYSIRHPGLKPNMTVAALVYLGLALADESVNNVIDLHIFTSEFVPGQEFPSARKWTSRKTKGIIRDANDW